MYHKLSSKKYKRFRVANGLSIVVPKLRYKRCELDMQKNMKKIAQEVFTRSCMVLNSTKDCIKTEASFMNDELSLIHFNGKF